MVLVMGTALTLTMINAGVAYEEGYTIEKRSSDTLECAVKAKAQQKIKTEVKYRGKGTR